MNRTFDRCSRWILAALAVTLVACGGDTTSAAGPNDATVEDAPAATRDAPAGETVADDVGAPQCPPGVTQARCPTPTSVVECDADGRGWTERPCPDGERCLAGTCALADCDPGAVLCTGPRTLSACLADDPGGFAWATLRECDGLCRDGACVGSCGFDIKQNEEEACEHFVIQLSGTPESACAQHDLLVVPSSAADEIAVFDLAVDPPAPLESSPFPTCDDPSRILVDRFSRVVATCRGDGRVNKHETDGTLLWSTELPGCRAVRGAVVGPDDRLFVGCTNTHDVHELDPETGDVLRTQETGIAVYGLAIDPTGIYVTDFGHLGKVSFIGGLHVVWVVDANGYGIATDGAGRVWLSEAPGLVSYSADDGTLLDAIPIPSPEWEGGSYCQGVAVGLDGRVYVGCAEAGDYLAVWDPADEELEVLQLPASDRHPRGVAVDRAGHVYTINLESSNVTRFDATSRATTSFGGGGQLAQPYGYSGDMTGLTACLFAGTTTWRSGVLDPLGETTHWLRIDWKATVPEGTSITVYYRLDDGPWVQVLAGMTIDAWSRTLEVEAVLESSVPDAAPTLHELAVFHD